MSQLCCPHEDAHCSYADCANVSSDRSFRKTQDMPSPRKQAQNTIKALSPIVKYKKYTTVPDPLLGTKVLQ